MKLEVEVGSVGSILSEAGLGGVKNYLVGLAVFHFPLLLHWLSNV